MSRSPPSLGEIEEPMITERPRGGGASDPVATAAAMAGPESYTYRPRSNPQNLGYTINEGGKFQTPANPLYAHDDSLISPKLVAGVKTGAIVVLALTHCGTRGFLVVV